MTSPVEKSRTMDALHRKLAVARGYEQIAAAYAAAKEDSAAIQAWVDLLAAATPAGGRLLDLGCGAAVPYTRSLAGRFAVTGIDVARAQLRLARANVPEGRFLQAEMSAVPFADGTFAAALSLYAIIHVPREEHHRVLREVHRVLRPAAVALLGLGRSDSPEDWDEYHGVPMHWSHYDAAASRRMVEACGFTIERADLVADQDGGAHLFLLVRRP